MFSAGRYVRCCYFCPVAITLGSGPVELKGTLTDAAGNAVSVVLNVSAPAGQGGVTPAPPVPAPVVPDAPHLAISFHAWDPYFTSPGSGETATAMLDRHIATLEKLAGSTPPVISRVRVDVGWSASQPRNVPPGMDNYYNRRLKSLFEVMVARKLQPYTVIHQSPAWARTAAWDPNANAVTNAEVKRFPDNPAAIGPWAAWFAHEFTDLVDEIEVWNEPNLTAFTGYVPGNVKESKAAPKYYVPVLKAFAEGARSGNKNIVLAGPNVSQCDYLWVGEAYKLGLGKYCDVIGVHAYQGRQAVAPSSVDTTGISKLTAGWEQARLAYGLPKLYEVMKANGDGAKPIWNTEAGWSASATGVGDEGVGTKWPTREAKAAAYHTQWLDMLVTGKDDAGFKEAYRKVTLSTVYELYDPVSKDAHQKGFEIIAADGSLKPQAKALVDWRAAHPRLRQLY